MYLSFICCYSFNFTKYMNFIKNTVFLAFFISGTTIYRQKTISAPENSLELSKTKPSNILHSTSADSVLIKVDVKDALYDLNKNNLPYFVTSKTTPYNQNAKPTLIINKTQLVTEPHASIIKKQFGKFLTQNFEIISIPSFCKNENLNHHKVIPFRFNNQNQIEELIDYSTNWQISSDVSRKLSAPSAFKNNSVLASGNWFKIGITKTGFYKIDKRFLVLNGISTANLNPKNIRIYGNGGKMLPELNSAFRYDDLEENAIQVIGESDGVFDDTDYILFYAKEVTGWTNNTSPTGLKFRSENNLYSDTSFYVINTDLGLGKRLNTPPASGLTPNVSSSSYDFYNYTETNSTNFIKSGRQFYGEVFDAYVFVTKLIKSAKKSIVLINNYCDETVLTLLSKRQAKVKASIYLNKIDAAFQLDIEKHNLQYAAIEVHLFKKAHDRF